MTRVEQIPCVTCEEDVVKDSEARYNKLSAFQRQLLNKGHVHLMSAVDSTSIFHCLVTLHRKQTENHCIEIYLFESTGKLYSTSHAPLGSPLTGGLENTQLAPDGIVFIISIAQSSVEHLWSISRSLLVFLRFIVPMHLHLEHCKLIAFPAGAVPGWVQVKCVGPVIVYGFLVPFAGITCCLVNSIIEV